MNRIILFIDDSGVLQNKNSSDKFFVYGGVYFFSESSKNIGSRKTENIKRDYVRPEQELKFNQIRGSKKRVKIARRFGNDFNTCYVTNEIPKLNYVDFSSAQGTGKYKDYALKRMVKKVLEHEINNSRLDPKEEIKLDLYIDQQLERTNGRYTLEETIQKEFCRGVRKESYFHSGYYEIPAICTNGLKLKIKFCRSENHYLIQAADIVAGYVRWSYHEGHSPDRLKKCVSLELP